MLDPRFEDLEPRAVVVNKSTVPVGSTRFVQRVLAETGTPSEHVTVASALRDLFLPHRPPDRTGVDWAISVCGLEDVVDRYPSEISLGKRKLVGIGRALARQPRLVLLDEPAAGLDTNESLELGRRLRSLPEEHGVTVFLIDHDMGLVLSVCDQLMVLDFGRQIAAGTPAEIRDNPRVIEAYLGGHHAGTGH